jgi:hypothetical protein
MMHALLTLRLSRLRHGQGHTRLVPARRRVHPDAGHRDGVETGPHRVGVERVRIMPCGVYFSLFFFLFCAHVLRGHCSVIGPAGMVRLRFHPDLYTGLSILCATSRMAIEEANKPLR